MIAGFRVERLLGEGEMGPVYEAVQLSLGRPVALRALAGSGPAGASVDHPNIVPVYEAGEWEGRRFVVSRLVRGESLAELLDAGSLSPDRFDEIMDAVSGAVAAAHADGLVHGRLAAHNVIVDRAGTPFVTDFGLGRAGTTEGDRQALAALWSRRPMRARRPAVVAAAAVLGVAVVVGLLLVAARDGADTGAAKPVESTGCAPDPDPNTPACTMSQGMVGGRPVMVRADGAVRRWAVRGAAGDLSLQVLRREDGRTVRAGFSQPARVRGPGPHAFPVNLDVRRGDRIGVLLAPGARIGLRPRTGATTQRWDGRRTPLPRPSTLAGQLLLRADVRPGA
ncbi:MAG TPA: protein kinase, partial [Thermoleophilaceae bacterium]|nr:protein kinase [Thermoleophilaceae bacterium]